MSAFPQPALSAVAFQLAGALEGYQSGFEEFLRSPPNVQRCRTAGVELDNVVMLRGALPQLLVQVIELLVCHTELVHVHFGAVSCSSGERAGLLARHRQAVEAMHVRCLRLFCRDAATA